MLTLVAVILALTVLPTPWNWIAVLAAATVDVAETAAFIWWSRRRRSVVGAETLIGRRAVVVTPLVPRGQVKLDGELWEARSASPVEPGREVTVRALDGLVLDVDASEER